MRLTPTCLLEDEGSNPFRMLRFEIKPINFRPLLTINLRKVGADQWSSSPVEVHLMSKYFPRKKFGKRFSPGTHRASPIFLFDLRQFHQNAPANCAFHIRRSFQFRSIDLVVKMEIEGATPLAALVAAQHPIADCANHFAASRIQACNCCRNNGLVTKGLESPELFSCGRGYHTIRNRPR